MKYACKYQEIRVRLSFGRILKQRKRERDGHILKSNWTKRKMALELTFLVMNSHCVPFPDAGAPDIIILRGSNFTDATIYNTHTHTHKDTQEREHTIQYWYYATHSHQWEPHPHSSIVPYHWLNEAPTFGGEWPKNLPEHSFQTILHTTKEKETVTLASFWGLVNPRWAEWQKSYAFLTNGKFDNDNE